MNVDDVRIVMRSSLSLLGVHTATDMRNAAKDCSKLWQETFMQEFPNISTLWPCETYGVSTDCDCAQGTFTYWAAIPAPEDFPTPDGMGRCSLQAGEYVCLTVPSLAQLQEAYTLLYDTWFKMQADYVPEMAAYSYELYPANFQETGVLELYVPIKKA